MVTVHHWLNGLNPRDLKPQPVPLGNLQRQGYGDGKPPASEQNAYEGSKLGAPFQGVNLSADISFGGGLNRLAIVKVEASKDDPYIGFYGTDPNKGNVGIQKVRLTGMIQQRLIGPRMNLNLPENDFLVVQHRIPKLGHPQNKRIPDLLLQNLDLVPANRMGIPANIAGANDLDTFVPYEVGGTIGRSHAPALTGPDGLGDGNNQKGNPLVAYNRPGLPEGTSHVLFPKLKKGKIIHGQSPPTFVETPSFMLPPPIKGQVNNMILPITVAGGFEVANAKLNGGTGKQTVQVILLVPSGKVAIPLERIRGEITLPDDAWNGLLLAYEFTANLKVNANNTITGNTGATFGPAPFPIFQRLADLNDFFNSPTIKIP